MNKLEAHVESITSCWLQLAGKISFQLNDVLLLQQRIMPMGRPRSYFSEMHNPKSFDMKLFEFIYPRCRRPNENLLSNFSSLDWGTTNTNNHVALIERIASMLSTTSE
jgi:hypothetical protein